MSRRLEELARALRSDRLTRTELADGTGVILHLEGAQVYSLNETGMFLVERLHDGEANPASLVKGLVNTFSIDERTARRDLDLFVTDLHQLLCG
jgi:hypothetical protein